LSGARSIGEADVAIVGMSGRFPGAHSVAELWRNLRDGVESIRPLGDAELLAAGVDPEDLRDPSYVKAAGVVDEIDRFDAGFFGLSPKDAAIMDPQHRVFLECAVEALEQAGHAPKLFPGSIGVFAGCGMNAYFVNNVLANPALVRQVGLFLLRHTGNDRDFLPSFVSYKLDLRGPSVAVQTACSTSLVAVHMACQSLLAGECDMALAGGVTLQVPHGQGYRYRENEPQSPDGHCRAFDHRSQGTVVTGGAGVVALRRLADALADGDPVLAVIKGSAVNNDGSTKVSYLAPSVDGHSRVVVEALAVAGLPADSISYVEAHGTGTAVGDPIEIAALTQAFRESTSRVGFCRIGSIKTNIGHLDTAAGAASLIKVVEALRHREIPPSLHFEAPNPAIDFASSPFRVNAELCAWESEGGPRRAGISSLGVGGTNAHVIVEEAPEPEPGSRPRRACELLLLSAKTPTALDAATARLAAHLREHPELELADVAHTLQLGRTAYEHRRVVVARSLEDAAAALEARDAKRVFTGRSSGASPSVAFLFPGAGGQHPNMGRGLFEAEPVYRRELERCLELLRPLQHFELRPLLFPDPGAEEAARRELERPSRLVGAVFATEWALAALWRSWGVEPAAAIGHSLGEYAAACLAGVLSLEDALRLVALRGRLWDRAEGGGMLAVPLPEAEVRELLGSELDLAASNAPSLCVVAGRIEAIRALEAELARREVEARLLRVAAAGHSRQIDPLLDEFRRGLAGIHLGRPRVPYLSNVTGSWIRAEEAQDPEYWVRHLRQTVRFSDGLAELLRDPNRILLEVGPGHALSSLARQQPARPRAVLASLRHPEEPADDLHFTLGIFGRVWLVGGAVDFAKLRGPERRRRVPLPSYPFERQRYWLDPPKRAEKAPAGERPLERLPRVEDWFQRAVWTRRDPPVPAPSSERLRWLVFLDEAGIGDELCARLEVAGHEVVRVRERDTFYRLGDREYALAPEAGRMGYDELVRDLASRDRLPHRVVHLWTVTADEGFRPGSSFLHRNQERGFYSLLFLAQALGDLGELPLRGVTVVSNGMQSVAGEVLRHPEKATLLGPVAVIPREFEGVACQSVDLELPPRAGGRAARQALAALAERLVADLAAEPSNAVVAWRGEERFERGFERAALGEGGGTPLRERGVYLVTGGLGGLGLAAAEHLARRVRARLVLVGRAGLPPVEHWERWLATHAERDATARRIHAVRRLEELGAEVLVAAADVANIERMAEVVAEARQRFGTLHGVIHAAGVLEDGVIQRKTPEAVERVFTPKVAGTLVLAELLRGQPLDFLVLFSSTSAVLGPPGQVDYAAANCFLDAFAEHRSQRGEGRTLAIGWGVWNDVGMAGSLAARLRGEPVDETGLHRLLEHPLLDECVCAGPERWLYAARYRADERWILEEHRTKAGSAIVPGTAYLELARAAWLDATGQEALEIRGLTFLAPLEVAEGEARLVEVELLGRDGGFDFEVRSRGASSSGGFEVNARGALAAAEARGAPRLRVAELEAACAQEVEDGGGRALPAMQADQVAFGPRWASLRRIGLAGDQAFARLELPAAFAGDLESYGLHPALLDVATGCGMRLLPDFDPSRALHVPLAYERVRVWGRLPQRLASHVRRRGGDAGGEVATFDLALADDPGEVLVEIEGFALRRIAEPARFGAGAAGARPDASTRADGGTLRHPSSAAERVFLESFELGLRAEEGLAALERILASAAPARLLVNPVDMARLRERSDAASAASEEAAGVKFARPNLQSGYEAPRDELEQALVGFWQDLLGVDRVGIQDDFFELGGHSLIAVRLFARIKKAYGVELPLSVLFEAPTIAKCAELLRAELGQRGPEGGAGARRREPVHRFLVAMNAVARTRKLPLFVVSGMFGNVLNLRHLAAHLGADQPVYALQAKGLYGDDEPHRRFEEMAEDYLREIRSLQPEGPYLLGGFSGGGITAFEMANQLVAQGEEIGLLVMLDSLPGKIVEPTGLERLVIQAQRLRRQGLGYVGRWARNRIRWEIERRRRPPERELTPAEFRSERIEAAFREALEHYRTPVYSGKLVLFRPPLDAAHPLPGGRVASSERVIVDAHNHWRPFVSGGIDVHVVPGDHDSMVLEPNVRVLAEKLRACLEDAQRSKSEAER
jgi:acyl transferase domain-containing protein/thioesterase domain-containing protein